MISSRRNCIEISIICSAMDDKDKKIWLKNLKRCKILKRTLLVIKKSNWNLQNNEFIIKRVRLK